MSDLPPGWEWSTLGDVAEIVLGQSPPGSSYNAAGEGLPFFQGKTEFGELHPTVAKWTTAPKKVAYANDVLLSVRAPVGPTNLALTRCAVGRGLAALRETSAIGHRYLLWWMRASEGELASRATGSTFTAVSGTQVRTHPVPLAPRVEQERIVAAIEEHLSRLDAADNLLRCAAAKLAVFEEIVYREILLLDAPRIALGSVVKTTSGGTPKRTRPDLYGGLIPWIKSGELGDGVVVSTEESISDQALQESSAKLLPEGTLLIAMYGATIGKLGRVGMPAAATNQAVAAMLPSDEVDSRFLWNVLRALRIDLVRLGKGGAQPNISQSILRGLEIPVPSLDVQTDASDALERSTSVYQEAVAAVDVALRRSGALRRSVLAAAFSGQLVPQDPDDEPASVLLERIRAERAAAPPTKRTRKAKAS